METFEAVEKVLAFHHNTSSAPMPLDQLLKGAGVQKYEFKRVTAIWPDAYRVSMVRLREYVEVVQVPIDLKSRRSTFQTRLSTPAVLEEITNTVAQPPAKVPVRAHKIVKNGPKPQVTLSMDEILARVARKQKENLEAEEKAGERRLAFLQAQIPAVIRVLETLRSNSSQYSSAEVVRKVQNSLKLSLSAEEVMQVLGLVSTQMPTSCRIVEAGRVQCIHLQAAGASDAIV